MSKLQWHMFKALEEEALRAGGFIFGGYVRDKVIHDHFATLFYESDASSSAYTDPMVHTESYRGRMWMPKDMDVVMSTAAKDKFLEGMRDEGYTVRELNTRDLKFYIPGVEANKFKHTKVNVSLRLHKLFRKHTDILSPAIEIDMVYKDDFDWRQDLDFGHIDFECNALAITPTGALDIRTRHLSYTSVMRNKKINKILDDIVNMRAVVPEFTKHAYATKLRVDRMLAKGFTIIDNMMTMKPASFAADPEDICIICHEAFKGKVVMGNQCCSGKYHVQCYHKLIISDRDTVYNNIECCAMCRCDWSAKYNRQNIYSNINDLCKYMLDWNTAESVGSEDDSEDTSGSEAD